MNYGSQKQEVKLPAGRPASSSPAQSRNQAAPPQVVRGCIAPPVDHTAVRALRTGGSRQFVDPQGKIRLWVNPMSIRVVLVNDNEPR